MDIKKDAKTGVYQISDADQTDDTYDLHGKMFEFSRPSDGTVFYQFVEKTKDEICPKPTPKPDDKPVVVKEDPKPAPPPIDHKKMSFTKRCSGLVHSCGECGFHEEHDLVTGEMRCGTYEFCFTYDAIPHCSDCSPFGEGCEYCDYDGCLNCNKGYWKMSGICVAQPW